jgi:hypothetical protein
MKRFLPVCLSLLAFAFCGKGQVNYVVNPSFEELIGCPSAASQIDSCFGWNTLLAGGGGNPDLYNICCITPAICGVPTQANYGNSQYAHFGNSYIGIQVTGNVSYSFREYIQSKLKKNLAEGHSYCTKFYCSLADNSHGYIRPLGAYFDDGSVLAFSFYGLAYANSSMIPAVPQVYNNLQQLQDKINWMKIEGSFIASGNEDYISLGNFFTDAASDTGIIGTPTIWQSYYFIDDVSVIDANLTATAGNDILIHPGDSTFIGRPSEVGLDEDCIWFINGVPIDTIAGMWVKTDTTTTYVLQQTICGNVKYDTVTVTVSGVGIGENGWEGKIKVYPNPAKDILNIEGLPDNATAEIYSINGKLLLNEAINNQQIDIRSLAYGMYFIKLSSAQGSVVRKFVKE